jgi:hypothetical protein
LYDINQVGKILFDSIQDSPEILFYRMPKASSAANGGSSYQPTPNSYQL